MKKQNYRSLAYAVAIAVSCAAVPGTSWAAEAPAASAQPMSSSAAPAVPEAANVKADAAAAPAEEKAAETKDTAADHSAAAQADAVATSLVSIVLIALFYKLIKAAFHGQAPKAIGNISSNVNRYFSARLGIEGAYSRYKDLYEADSYHRFTYATGSFDGMLNLTNVFCKQNHPLNFYVLGGVGLNWSGAQTTNSSRFSPNLRLGA